MIDTPRLRELKERLQQLDKLISDSKTERAAVRVEIAAVRQEERQRRRGTGAAVEPQVLARWEAGMSATDIARTMDRERGQIERIINAWREREGVTIRRGRTIPERRIVKNGRSPQRHSSR